MALTSGCLTALCDSVVRHYTVPLSLTATEGGKAYPLAPVDLP